MAVPQDRLNVIALISGGKDSFFALLHCLANAHQVVALANLYPPIKEDIDDLNSHMYQTVGHTLVPLYAQALDLPLYRHEISGTAKDVSKVYGTSSEKQTVVGDEGEETESLVPLLKKVIAACPGANAVCSGAILSTYQRTRIEAVALRLGLTPLSYLWQYPALPPPSPGGLLDDMAVVGLAVRIVKVASGGLDDSFLWCDLMDTPVRKKIQKNISRYGGSALGEGGEYETLVTDGPRAIWKRRLEIDQLRTHHCLDGGSDGAAWLAFQPESGKVVEKDYPIEDPDWKLRLRPIGLWDEAFGLILRRMPNESSAVWTAEAAVSRQRPSSVDVDEWAVKATQGTSTYTLDLSNLTAVSAGNSAAEQMMGIKEVLIDILREFNRTTRDIMFTTLVLESMSDFASVNATYAEAFQLNPPARVTFASCLPRRVRIMASFVISVIDCKAREALHVQSRSYWTPANIGPYSQATSIDINEAANSCFVYVAGQIPLVPATMRILKSEDDDLSTSNKGVNMKVFYQQSCLALQHLWRIGTEMHVGWWTGAIAFIAGEDNIESKSSVALQIWEEVHSRSLWAKNPRESEDLDVWDMKYLGSKSWEQSTGDAQVLPDFSMLSDTETSVPGFFAVQVDELPRDCDIEWQSLGISHSKIRLITTLYDSFEVRRLSLLSSLYTIVFLSIYQRPNTETLGNILEQAQVAHPFSMTIYTPRPSVFAWDGAQVIPCRKVWGCGRIKLAAGIVLHIDSSAK